MVAKRLVYHFFANEGWEDNFANKIHFKCLSCYTHIFDEALIVISVDDWNRGIVEGVKKKFCECIKSDSITIKVVRNDSYYEGGTFKREVVDRLTAFDGLVFFAHNKGVACIGSGGEYDPDSLRFWICAMYFYNLGFCEEVERKLCVEHLRAVYGTFLMQHESIRNASHTWFQGTFYWLNPGRVVKWAERIPELFDREYAEWFTGEVFGENSTLFFATRSEIIIELCDLYYNAKATEDLIAATEEDKVLFNSFMNNIGND